MGGVNTALGADITSISNNPAGLGFYRKSEWSFTPSLNFTNNSGTMLGNSVSDGNSYFGVPNFGVAFSNAKPDSDRGDWRGGTWGISYNRTSNFNNRVSYLGGVNRNNSIVDYLRSTADGLDIAVEDLASPGGTNQIGFNVGYDETLAQLAYSGFLIDALDADRDGQPDPDNYYRSNLSRDFRIGFGNELIEDPKQIRPSGMNTTTGSNNQWSVGYGGNYKDKVYFGAALGIASIRYSQREDYTESVVQSTFDLLDNYTLSDNLDVSGTGFNGTFGAIYRPNDLVRVGLSFTTPTIFRLSETSHTSLATNLLNPGAIGLNPNQLAYSSRSIDNQFNYRLTTPMRASAGVAVFLGKYGFISGDVEYRPFRAARVNGDFPVVQGVNDAVRYNSDIRNTYQNVFDFRVGGEFRYEIFRLRGGAAYQSDPFQRSVDNLNRQRFVYTGGAGVKVKNFFADLAVAFNQFQQAYTPYPLGPSATFQNKTTTASITIGSSF